MRPLIGAMVGIVIALGGPSATNAQPTAPDLLEPRCTRDVIEQTPYNGTRDTYSAKLNYLTNINGQGAAIEIKFQAFAREFDANGNTVNDPITKKPLYELLATKVYNATSTP